MPERLVLCGEAAAVEQDDNALRLFLGGTHANVRLRLHDLRRPMVADVPAVIADLVEIAAYVHCADQAISRGGDARRGMGTDWRRRFHFMVPVREPDLWSSPGIEESLASVLGFLSEDNFRFEFMRQRAPPSFQSYLDFAQDEPGAFQADEVVLFSGGMDSLCGTIEELMIGQHRIALVTTILRRRSTVARSISVTNSSAASPDRFCTFRSLSQSKTALGASRPRNELVPSFSQRWQQR